jgi:WhiB family redox-sensing transcriptional regulator
VAETGAAAGVVTGPWAKTRRQATACPGGAVAMPQAVPGASGHAREDEPPQLTDRELLVRVTSPQARCTAADVDPDEWFPIATRWELARAGAAHALAVCAACPVRAECLEFSLRQWDGAGRYGIWGGLLEGERTTARRQWLTGISVTQLLAARHEDCSPRGRRSAAP